jgi:hypothetical protein
MPLSKILVIVEFALRFQGDEFDASWKDTRKCSEKEG